MGALVRIDNHRFTRVAGFFQQLLRPRRIIFVAPLFSVLVIRRPRIDRGIVQLTQAFGCGRHHLRDIQRRGDCLAHLHVLQHRILRLEQQHMLDGIVRAEHGQRLDTFQFAHIRVGDLACIDGARHQAGLRGGRVRHHLELHVVHQRPLRTQVAVRLVARRRSVILECAQQRVLAALPFLEHVGAGADRLDPRAIGRHRILGQNRGHAAIRARQGIQEYRRLAVHLHHDRLRIRRAHLRDLQTVAAIEIAAATPVRLGVHVALPAPEHVGRGQRGAVMELDAVTQCEGIGQPIRRQVHGLGQQRADRAVFTVAHQPFHNVQHHAIGRVIAVDAGVG
ncbi:hypothetical protein D3C86_1352650 [compost metagenome]